MTPLSCTGSLLYSGSLRKHSCIMYLHIVNCHLHATQGAVNLQEAEFGGCVHQVPSKPPCHWGGVEDGTPSKLCPPLAAKQQVPMMLIQSFIHSTIMNPVPGPVLGVGNSQTKTRSLPSGLHSPRGKQTVDMTKKNIRHLR